MVDVVRNDRPPTGHLVANKLGSDEFRDRGPKRIALDADAFSEERSAPLAVLQRLEARDPFYQDFPGSLRNSISGVMMPLPSVAHLRNAVASLRPQWRSVGVRETPLTHRRCRFTRVALMLPTRQLPSPVCHGAYSLPVVFPPERQYLASFVFLYIAASDYPIRAGSGGNPSRTSYVAVSGSVQGPLVS